ncbi:MAG: 3-dehydroquinate synthase [Ignavibacteria bacterium]|jgi:3-dehydroquinate synthase|nr:3-dehydroquinate synthase [Ignavibacteria bacterium]MCU7503543.1 3-dehydroquinate synthase [Ignavibacteria bacterium]MCU7516803.1 3-dehydroquinate synthase [Ignavibacteria bacterium]
MRKFNIELKDKKIPVLLGEGIFGKITSEIEKRKLNRNILLITDSNVNRLYRKKVENAFSSFKGKFNLLTLRPGENTKSQENLNKIYSFLLKKKYSRDTLIIALGGGVIGDLAGFAAATFMRGVKYIQVPTTLLAVSDSAIGGKTGINFNGIKNIIGAFYQPEFVLADLEFIKTLPDKEVLCGTGEILKYAYLSDRAFYRFIEDNAEKLLKKDPAVVEKAAAKSVSIKTSIVSEDEKEGGKRKILNLGHTFAHAYESVLEYKIKHGEAVIAGLACALILSRRLGCMNEEKFMALSGMLKKFHPGIKFNKLKLNVLFKAMLSDKKNRDGKIRFVLLEDVGKVLTDVEAGRKDVLLTLKEAGEFFSR